MSIVPLPDEPSFEQLRNQAKDLRRAIRSGEPAALAELAAWHPEARLDPTAPVASQLATAQLVVARRHGFASWARLKRHVEVIERFSRFPDRLTAREPIDLADRFLRLALIDYEDSGPARWSDALALLVEHPRLADDNVQVAAAAADVAALRRILAEDPEAARREGGPYRWEPLLSLAYARHDPSLAESAVLESARLLLDAGADPNAGYLWHALTTPFTVLTGVFGEGEQGPVRQPRHPHALALARLLLEAGADANDAQALYNRMFGPDDDHLALLFEFGLGTGDGGPWRRRLGDAIGSPSELVRGQLRWAILHGMTARVELLAAHGADLASPDGGGATPTDLAATSGHPELVRVLVALGGPAPDLRPDRALVAALLAGDRAAVEQLMADEPGLLDRVRDRRPGLLTWAATTGRSDVVELLVERGFDVNAMGRSDVPSDQPWQTALHRAAEVGDVDLARTLLRLGADPDVLDRRFNATPLGWAEHFGHEPMVGLLSPLTSARPVSTEGGDET